MFRYKNKIIGLLVCLGILVSAGFVFAQPNLGLNEFGAQTQLGTTPIGVTIANIVRVFLSVLGIIAVILTLYAGFLWMTAAGDATKIATAKKLLINAVIGLAIILSSLAITQFIIGALSAATGTNVSAIGGGGGGGGLPGNAFVIQGITPSGNIPIRNVVVRVALNHSPDTSTVNGNVLVIKKSDNSITAMTFAVNNNTIELTPSASCPAPNTSAKCLDANATYDVQVKTALKDTGGNNLNCGGFAPNCTVEFVTGSLVDTQPPQVAVTYPDPGQAVPENSPVAVWAKATDDSAVAQIDFFADSAYFGKAVPPPPSPALFDGKVFWDTTGATRGTHSLSAKAYDIDSNSTISAPLTVNVLAAHCFNNVKDADETGIDCGGADCLTCSGGACTQNSDCASNSCVNGLCVDTPVILGVSPADGAPGTYVTISGKYFGTTPGTVTFLGATGTADDKVAPLAPCNGAWSDTQIVVVAPQGVVSGPISVKTAVGTDATNDARGPVLPDFVVTSILRPGICSLTPAAGKSGTTFTISGTEFGASQGASFIKFGNVYAAPQTWSNVAISALVPVLSAGDNSVQINRNGVDSNAVNFSVLSLTAGTKPSINYVDPGTGPPGEYITIFGSNFGDTPGVAQFLRADGTVALGDTNFPASCAAINYWHNSYVTVKVPAAFSDGTPTKNTATNLRVRRADAALSNSVAFSINTDTPKPGICGLQPDNGPVGTSVNILGERFGSAGAVTFYNNVGASAVWGSEMIQTAAPKGAVSGPVKVTVASKDSNSVNFSVSDCSKTPGLCTVDEQCCAGSCLSKTAVCQAAPKEGAYAWHISTGIIPKVPHVIEECSTADKAASPSPSPWDARPGGNSVCVNAIVNIHFDSQLDANTVIMSGLAADTIALYKCTGVVTSSTANPCVTKVKISLDPIYSGLYHVNATDDGVQLYPAGQLLEKNTQYRVELTTGIKGAGAGGGYMEEKTDCGKGLAYCFNFKTANSDGLCKVGSLVTSPQDYTSSKKESLEYMASPKSKDDVCININASVYTYDWTSSQSAAQVASIGFNLAGQAKANDAIIKTLAETPPGTPAIITSTIPAEKVSGNTNLTVKFADPVVVDKWPSCTTACVNSVIGAKFNVDMDPTTISPTNISVFVCTTENCDAFSGTVAGTISYKADDVTENANDKGSDDATENSFNFTPSQNLSINTFYQVRLNAKNIKSASGVALTGANFGSYYIWQFRTKNDATPCTVNKVNVSPESQVFNYIPQIAPFDSQALGAPDECNPQGQMLNPYDYNWSWNSGATAIVSLVNNGAYNVLPPKGIGCNDQCLRTGSMPDASVCGNGKVEKGESCDLGAQNGVPGSGCSTNCLRTGTTAPTCGNGKIDPGEDCDRGALNGQPGSGCSANCLATGSVSGGSVCGNGTIGYGENCDDGNAVSGDGCSSQCLNEGTQAGIASCGDGIVEKDKGEDCDLGAQNGVPGSGCSANCLATGTLAPTCGNNVIDPGETCDDGNLIDGDGCSSRCLSEGANLNYGSICGDGVVGKGESCDNGPADSNVDPRQYGQAVSAGKTKINAVTQNVSGSSDVEVQCVSTSDAQCQRYGANLGVGTDNCCYARPQVILTVPSAGQTGVCRNTLISATFDKIMDANAGQISIDQKKNGTDCSLLGAKEVTDDFGVVWCQGAIKATRTVFDDTAKGQTEFDWNIENILAAGKTYRVVLTDFKNKGGVSQSVNPYSWTFTAGNNICKVDQVKVTANPMIFSNLKPASADNPNGSPRQAQAQAISLPNNPISNVQGIYAWNWSWSASPADQFILLSASAYPDTENVSAKDKNGEETLSATASFTADKYNLNNGSTNILGTARVIVFLCEHPWPGLQSFPWTDAALNASTYYCRDTAANQPLLPNLSYPPVAVAPSAADIVKEFLLTSPSGDAVGLRVYQNLNHLSPLAWYKAKQFVGNPSSAQMDGYDAVVDGRTTYANAANHIGPNYTNIFVISYSQTAAPEMQSIYKQMLANWKFNTNLTNSELCAATKKTCTSDADCNSGDTCGTTSKLCAATLKACVSDLDCAAGDTCNADKDKVRRDVKRLQDLNDFAAFLENYKTSHNGFYPQVLSGSFLRGMSVSAWSSWQAALGNDLGRGLPQDPLNKHAVCAAPYDSTTCWDGKTGQYICPSGSHVYRYQNLGGTNYQLATDFEYFDKDWKSPPNAANTAITNSCVTSAVFGTSSVCGDGVVNPATEQCELGQTKIQSCGTTNQFQKFTCSSDCKSWIAAGDCSTGQCGDGVVQAGEICDDGQNNGKYGYCNTTCSGLSTWCGDGIKNGPEQCDNGDATHVVSGKLPNGTYGSGCSWDCKVPGPSCGDNIIQASNEQCDGNSETKNTDAAGNPCLNVTINGVSYPTQNTRNCNPPGSAGQCLWGEWSGCKPAGVCGNGVKDGTEQCDTGSSGTAGACVMDLAKLPAPYACKTAVCGDGYLWTNHEACDFGSQNGVACNAGYGLTCNYCGTSCNIVTKTGPYCGDGVKSGPEECDNKDFGGLSCKDFGFLVFSSGTYANQTWLSCNGNCTANTSQCKSVIHINAGGPDYKDSQGREWVPDVYFDSNSGYWPPDPNTLSQQTITVSGNYDQTIYKTGRYGDPNDLKYVFPTGPGTFKVRLHFVAIFPGYKSGDNVFNINFEGTDYLKDFDILNASAGGAGAYYAAVVKEFVVTVNDSELDLLLHATKGNASINAIEIESVSAGGPQYTAPVLPSGYGGPVYNPPPACTPNCSGKQCGSDGCGGVCGSYNGGCQSGYTCNSSNQCAAQTTSCTPIAQSTACAGKCGNVYISDGCAGNYNCGNSCPAGQTCSYVTCVAAAPSCTNDPGCSANNVGQRVCDSSGNSQLCTLLGSCYKYTSTIACISPQQICSGGQCVTAAPTCTPKTCAQVGATCGNPSDGCGGTLSCGSCQSGYTCNSSNQCAAQQTSPPPTCTPNCTGAVCGASNGCGGKCLGSCPAGQECNIYYQCYGSGTGSSACVPNCTNKQCGPNGCGGSCGSCVFGQSCSAVGRCI